jgi:hypothetical protein
MTSLFVDLGKVWLEWRGKYKAAPQYKFKDDEIVSPPYLRKVSRFSQATFVNLHPTHFGVAIAPDGRMINLKGGYNSLPPGYYNIHYVDKQNRVNYIPRTEDVTLDGFKVAMELVISYRVIDPIKALEVQNPIDTLLRFIQANLKEFIRSHKYEQILGDIDGRKIEDDQVIIFIKERHIDRSPLAKLFYIVDVVVKERIGDPKVIEMREKYQISQKQLDNQKSLQTMNQELEKKIADQDALIKQIKANSAATQQSIIQQMEMQKIELEKARAEFKYRQEIGGKAVDAIVQTLSNQTYPPDSAEYDVIRELLSELSAPTFQNGEGTKGSKAPKGSVNTSNPERISELTNKLLNLNWHKPKPPA